MTADDKVLAYAQSRMSTAQRTAFEAELEQDLALRAQLAALQAAGSSFAKEQEEVPQEGWARFSRLIESHTDTDTVAPANDNRPIRFSLLQVASIAVAAVVSWQVVGSLLWQSDPAGYVTASALAEEPALKVAFTHSAALGDVGALLLELEGRIIDGPSALGLYTIAFPDAAARDKAAAALRARADLSADVTLN